MAHNLKTPQNIYGPFQHTLFLGCSVQNFSVSAGFNGESTNLTVNIVTDNKASATGKIYYDANLDRQVMYDADPGFTFPNVGSPAYFRIGDFEYCGIIQSWVQKNDGSENPAYSIKLTDPSIILDNCQVIVDSYAGPTNNVYNLVNVYGFLESLGTPSPQLTLGGATFGSPAGAFGYAETNNRGTPWNKVRNALSTLLSSTNPIDNAYVLGGRVYYIGTDPTQQGYGAIPADLVNWNISLNFTNNTPYIASYIIDLSELPFSSDLYRVSGPSVSILELITQVCADSGCEFYTELLPVKIGGQILKVIKVRVISRRVQADTGIIQAFVDSQQFCQSKSIGVELRNEETSVFLIGGNKTYIYEPTGQLLNGSYYDTGVIMPYWGTDSSGRLNRAFYNTQWWVNLDFNLINSALSIPITGSPVVGPEYASEINTLYISEAELKLAVGNDEEKLIDYAIRNNTPLGTVLQEHYDILQITNDGAFYSGITNTLPGDFYSPGSIFNLRASRDFAYDSDIKNIVGFLNSYAAEHYGKKFIVRMPYVSYVYDPETNQYYWSDQPAVDGGWLEMTSLIGYYGGSGALLDYFASEDGRYPCLTRFYTQYAENLDVSDLNKDSYLAYIGNSNFYNKNTDQYESYDGYHLIARADIDPNWIVGTPMNTGESSVHALITLPGRIAIGYDLLDPVKDADKLSTIVDPLIFSTSSGSIYGYGDLGFAGKDITAYGTFNYYTPMSIAIPVKSNTQTYGPWGVSGPPGPVKVEYDEGLVPWEYGGYPFLNAAATEIVENAVSYMRIAERGEIDLPGYPILPIGACLNGATLLGGQALIETRTINVQTFNTTYSYYYIDIGMWDGSYGPNITNMNVNVGSNGISTTYTFNTYTRSPNSISKANADRIKQIGQNRLKNIRDIRLANTSKEIADIRNNSLSSFKRELRALKSEGERSDPISHRIGKKSRRSSPNRTLGGTISSKDIPYLPLDESANPTGDGLAITSDDFFYRPVSKSGLYNLPRYVVTEENAGLGALARYKNRSGDELSKAINIYSLDPIPNPSSTFIMERTSGDFSGHDIDVLGRTNIKSGSLSINITNQMYGNGSGYSNDYAFHAIRGPILLHGWCYDTNGKPTPNVADTGAINGVFETFNLTDKFATGWLQDPNLWPVAPIDLRLDRRRGVFVSYTEPFILLEASNNILSSESGTGIPIFTKNSTYDESGNLIIRDTVYNNSGDPLDSGLYSSIFNNTSGDIPFGAHVLSQFNDNRNAYDIYGIIGYKDIEFYLTEDLSKDMEYCKATIYEQFGIGINRLPMYSGILVKNFLEAQNVTSFTFAGPSGTHGLASWSSGNVYKITQLSCGASG